MCPQRVSPAASGRIGINYSVRRIDARAIALRLGPFDSEDEADAILKIVRDIYPGALTATADADDLRAIANLRAKLGVLPPPAEKPPASIEKAPASVEIPVEELALAADSLPPDPKVRRRGPPQGRRLGRADGCRGADAFRYGGSSAKPMAPTCRRFPLRRPAPAKPTVAAAPTPSLMQAVPATPKISAMPMAGPKVPARVPAAMATFEHAGRRDNRNSQTARRPASTPRRQSAR